MQLNWTKKIGAIGVAIITILMAIVGIVQADPLPLPLWYFPSIIPISNNNADNKYREINRNAKITWIGSGIAYQYDLLGIVSGLTSGNSNATSINNRDMGQVFYEQAGDIYYNHNDIFIDQLTTTGNCYHPASNDYNQLVWDNGGFIWLRDNGNITNLNLRGTKPRINNKGQIVYEWNGDIYLYKIGESSATRFNF